jgi:methylmalonyl-CoA mutase
VDRLAKVRASRNEAEVKACLEEIRTSARLASGAGKLNISKEANLLNLSVKAARARATVGEISDAMRDVWGDHVPTNSVVQGAYSTSFMTSQNEKSKANFSSLQANIEKFTETEGRRYVL